MSTDTPRPIDRLATDPVAELAASCDEIMTITVEEQVTIFRGPDTVYRYDLPSSGIIEGWALLAVIDQARELASLRWPEVEIVIDAAAHPTEILLQALLNKGVVAYPAEAVRETALPDPFAGPISQELTVERPTGGSHRLAERSWPRRLVLGGAAAAVVALGSIAGGMLSESREDEPGEAKAAVAASTSSLRMQPPPSSTSSPLPRSMVHETETLRVATPPGFWLEPQANGLLRLVGEDADLRINVAVDPVYSVSPELVMQEVVEMIKADPTLSAAGDLPVGALPEGTRVAYQELPGDGSEVAWMSWVTTGQQFSVGCHTRTSPTLSQQAACRMAQESLALR